MSLTTPRAEPVSILQRDRELRPDLFLVLAYLALAGIGIVMVHTASAPRLELLGADPASLMRRQAIFAVLGVGVFIMASMIESFGDYHACSYMAGAGDPSSRQLSRGIGAEGIGCFLTGVFGYLIGVAGDRAEDRADLHALVDLYLTGAPTR